MHARDIMTKTVVSVKPTVAVQLAAHTDPAWFHRLAGGERGG